MINNKFLLLIITFALPVTLAYAEDDLSDTLNLRSTIMSEVEIVSSPKLDASLRQLPTSATQVSSKQMTERNVTSLKGISGLVPNFFMPDYGSRLTSAIYIRGVGSRMNTPAAGLYVDNIPYVDKSAFDFNFYDIERVDVMRGPQGTLYGRNTMAGLVKVYTRNPLLYQGTDLKLGYATGDNHRSASLTHYHSVSRRFGFSAGGYYEGGDGFFRNSTTGSKIDDIQAAGGRMRAVYLPADNWKMDMSISYDHSSEGAYPYYYTGSLGDEEEYAELTGKISNNHRNTYRRGLLNAGVNIEHKAERWQMNSVTGYQFLRDRMFLDQDFIAADIYTLLQKQRGHTFTEELTFKNRGNKRWQWISGATLTYQALNTKGPVTFMPDGVRWLNQTIQSHLPVVQMQMGPQPVQMPMTITLTDEQLVMGGNFDTPFINTALYHQSTVSLTDKLSLTAGLRLDYEHNRMTYDAPGEIGYDFKMTSPMMPIILNGLRARHTFADKLKHDYFNVQPKLSLQYSFDSQNSVYATVSEGVRSSGYNVQLFSDLLQAQLQGVMMTQVKDGSIEYLQNLAAANPNMPAYVVQMVSDKISENIPQMPDADVNGVTHYKPESSWNYEVGTHLTLLESKLSIDASVFYMQTRNQQIVRFSQSGLGRQMVNAGKSQSCGAELALQYTPTKEWTLQANYGFTHARFTDYDDGRGNDYSDNAVPFVPEHTVGADAAYRLPLRSSWAKSLTFGVNYTGVGQLYWTEANDVRQPYYSLLGARVVLDTKWFQLQLWGRNITNAHYNTFYFESAQRGYEQHGKPAQAGIDVRFSF